jgi:hypothetical protein
MSGAAFSLESFQSFLLTIDNVTTAQTDALDSDACAYTATDSIRCLKSNFGAGATGSATFKTIVE